MRKLLLAGYFGCGNLGDDAIMQGYVDGMRRSGFDGEFLALSGAPETIQRNYGMSGYNRKDLRAVRRAVEETDALVFPGGSLFQDATSARSVAYYRELVRMGKKAGKKVLLLGQGVGPLTSYLGKRMAADAFGLADVVAVRDPASANALQQLGVKRAVAVAADSAFLLPPVPPSDESESFSVAGMRSIGIAPRPFGKGKGTVELFAQLCAMLYKAQLVPVLIEMDRIHDGELIDAIEKSYGGRISHLRKLDVALTAQHRIARMDGMIAMRLHAGILAVTAGVPPLMVSYDPKTTAFARLAGMDAPPLIENLTAQRLFELFQQHQRLAPRYRQVMARQLEEMRRLAQLNVDLSVQALAG